MNNGPILKVHKTR